MGRRKMKQLEFRPTGRGGRRPGAGRPKRKTSGVPHLTRQTFSKQHPLHVTLKIRREVGDLRTDKRFLRIQRAFRYGCDRFGMRMLQFSVQGDHIHLVVEADNRDALSKGMQGLAIRLARGINRISKRKGPVFSDRYHARVLKTLAEVRNAVHYVFYNRQKHERQRGREPHPWYIDPFSSASGEACWYVDDQCRSGLVIAAPKTWLMNHVVP